MFVNSLIQDISDRYIKDGKAKLAQNFPRDFELYMCALELVDPDGEQIDYFLFPIMPKNINKNETEATSVQFAFSGISVFNKDGFTPNELIITGDFGRALKMVELNKESLVRGINYSISEGYYSSSDVNLGKNFVTKVSEIPFGIKTGFGCIKILQSIISKAKSHDSKGRTFHLYFYNPALGESYLVVPTKNPLVLSMNDQSTNMIWQYTLNLVIIADLNDVDNSRHIIDNGVLNFNTIQKSIWDSKNLVDGVNRTIKNKMKNSIESFIKRR